MLGVDTRVGREPGRRAGWYRNNGQIDCISTNKHSHESGPKPPLLKIEKGAQSTIQSTQTQKTQKRKDGRLKSTGTSLRTNEVVTVQIQRALRIPFSIH